MDSFENEDIDSNVFEDVQTVSLADRRREHYDRNQSNKAINDEATKVGTKKRTKKTSDAKVTKRPKMSDDDDDVADEGTTKSMIILGLKCPQSECEMMFESVKQLHQHQKSAHGFLPYPCLVAGCSEQFSYSRQIGCHNSTVHPHHTDWTCAQCYIKKPNPEKLRTHIREFHQFGLFHCAYSVCTFEANHRVKVQNHQSSAHPHCFCPIDGCGKSFSKKSILQQHLRTCNHTNTKSTSSKEARFQILKLKCVEGACGDMFDTLNGLQQHQKIVHNVLSFSCLVTGCSEQSNSFNTMASHYSTVLPDHTNWNCPKCEAKLLNLRLLRQHIFRYHQLGRFQCAHVGCTFEADVRSKVLNHNSNVHGSKVVDLTEVSTTFTQADQENRSEIAIKNPLTSDEPTNLKIIILELKCTQSECDLKFTTWDQLYQHQENVHGVLRFPCLATGCSEQFSSNRKVGHHIRIIHPNHTNWTCSYCNVECASSTSLRTHLKIHDNFGRFRCSKVGCVFEANNPTKMYTHFKTHVRHICSIDGCDRVFDSKISLERHQQSVHFA